MDKKAINIAFNDIEHDYQKYIERNKLEDTTSELLKYLVNHNIIPCTQLKRYFVLSVMNKNQSNGIAITETVNTIACEFDISENTSWNIRKNNARDFRNKKIIS